MIPTAGACLPRWHFSAPRSFAGEATGPARRRRPWACRIDILHHALHERANWASRARYVDWTCLDACAVKPVLHFLADIFSLGLIVVATVYNSNANTAWYRCGSITISHGLTIYVRRRNKWQASGAGRASWLLPPTRFSYD